MRTLRYGTVSTRLSSPQARPCRRRRRSARAFTLVELLVVLVIIGVLGSIVMFAMFGAQESAREAKTKNMISKLNALVMRRYESYINRRVPLSITPPNNEPRPNEWLSFRRLQALRELMRLEMPDRWTDIRDNPVTGIERPAVNRTYLRKITAANNGAGVNDTDLFQGAECLYMIVAFGLEESDGLTHFSQSDIGDTDGDGLLEFLDGWGRPISFLRWPAGFDSPRQSRNPALDFDQFNTRRINPDIPQSAIASGMPRWRQFALYPLIYSAGPDRDTDIATTPVSGAFSYSVPARGGVLAYVDPYAGKSAQDQVGTPMDDETPPDGLGSVDNIHNHDLTIR
jgi:prepilin-type N-terminal cleavage/methylation domain-containing protein